MKRPKHGHFRPLQETNQNLETRIQTFMPDAEVINDGDDYFSKCESRIDEQGCGPIGPKR
jgi:hypothetical protein